MYDPNATKVISEEELQNGRVYKLKSRNLFVGVWNAAAGGFIGVREKFGDRYLFTEYLYKELSGTAQPVEALDLWAGDIPLTEYLGSFCQTCDQSVESVWNDNGTKKICTGNTHTTSSDCPAEGTYCAYVKMNKPLFDLMDELDREFADEHRKETELLWDTVQKSRSGSLTDDL